MVLLRIKKLLRIYIKLLRIKKLSQALSELPAIRALKLDLEKKKNDLNEFGNFSNGRFEEIKTEIIVETNKVTTELKAEVMKLKEEVEDLKSYQRRNNLEIHGIPSAPDEDLYEVVIKVGAALNVGIDYRNIDIVHRLPTRKAGDQQPILVRFTNRWIKMKILNAKKTYRTLSLDQVISSQDARPIYINEHLTLKCQALYKRARHLRAKNHYKYAWVRDGKVFLRKTDDAKVIQVSNEVLMKNIESQCGITQDQ